jgi:hypothetical protein
VSYGRGRHLDTYLCSKAAPVALEHGEEWAVKREEGATYRDLWSGVELKPTIEGGYATIELTLGARNIGVMSQTL